MRHSKRKLGDELGVESNTEPVKELQPQTSAALPRIRSSNCSSGDLDTRIPKRFWRKRHRQLARHLEFGVLARAAVNKIESHSGAESGRPDTETGVPANP